MAYAMMWNFVCWGSGNDDEMSPYLWAAKLGWLAYHIQATNLEAMWLQWGKSEPNMYYYSPATILLPYYYCILISTITTPSVLLLSTTTTTTTTITPTPSTSCYTYSPPPPTICLANDAIWNFCASQARDRVMRKPCHHQTRAPRTRRC